MLPLFLVKGDGMDRSKPTEMQMGVIVGCRYWRRVERQSEHCNRREEDGVRSQNEQKTEKGEEDRHQKALKTHGYSILVVFVVNL